MIGHNLTPEQEAREDFVNDTMIELKERFALHGVRLTRDQWAGLNDSIVASLGEQRVKKPPTYQMVYPEDGGEPFMDCPHAHPDGESAWVYTGSAYGGDDDSYRGEGRVYCSLCGEDGDA